MDYLPEDMDSLPENVVSLPRSGAVAKVELRQVCDLPDADDFSQQRMGSSNIDRLLFDAFLRQRRRSRGPLVALSERIMIVNASAAEFLVPSDRPRLWDHARELLVDGPRQTGEFVLGNGVRVVASHRAVMANREVVGALVQLSLPAGHRSIGRCEQAAGMERSVGSWWTLTDSERAVAELVAQGLTNRDAGRRIYLSRHTVDSHLRQIFRKLNITSRVELARIAGEHCGQFHNMQLGLARTSEAMVEVDMALHARPEEAFHLPA